MIPTGLNPKNTTRILLAGLMLPSPLLAQSAKQLQRVSADQIHKSEWLNKEIEIEDRISEFRKHGSKYDEIALKGTPVPVMLPPQMRLDRPSPYTRGRFTGRVIKIGNIYQFMVTTMDFLPSEREELAQKVAKLSPTDAQKRLDLAAWAETQATRYRDTELKTSVRKLREEAYKIIGTEDDDPGTKPGSAALQAATDARKAGSDAVIVQGLAHLSFQKALKKVTDQAGLEALSKEVASFLPDSTRAQSGKLADSAKAAYEKDPLKGYVEASPADRKLLDRTVMADTLEKGLMATLTNQPQLLEQLMETAKRAIPERPELADSIRDQGLLKLVDNSNKLHRDDLIKLVNRVRDKFGQAELARKLAKSWLDSRQATQLADGDAEGRYSLAQDYLALLGDKRSSAALLRECLTIDPDMQKASKSLADLGWRKDGDRWIDPDEPGSSIANATAAATNGTKPLPKGEMPNLPGGRLANRPGDIPAPPQPNQPPANSDPQSLVGLTQAQITAKFGTPEYKARMATQGQIQEQWYYDTPGGRQVVQFQKKSVRSEPTVKAVYQFAK